MNKHVDPHTNEELTELIQKDRMELSEWISKPYPNKKPKLIFSPKIFGITFYAIGEEWFDFHNFPLGGLEKISCKIQNVEMDSNNNGIIEQIEFDKNTENLKKTIDNCLSQFLNYSVIGGLFVSVLYSVALTELPISQASSDFFPDPVIQISLYIHYALVYYSLLNAFLLIYRSTRAYLHLGVWMPNLKLKHWYINKITMVPFHDMYTYTMKSAIMSIPFGVAITITPFSGLISFLLTCLFLWEHTKTSATDVKLCMKIHDYIKEKIESKKCLDPPRSQAFTTNHIDEITLLVDHNHTNDNEQENERKEN